MKIILFLFFVAFSFLSRAQTYKVDIIHINDVHAKIDNFGKLSSYIEACKKECDTVFVFSAGDLFSGNPIVDQYSYKGYPIIDLMNKTGFLASAIGNHEFDYGQEGLNSLAKDASFKFLCLNMNTDNAVFKNYEKKMELNLTNDFHIVVSGIIHRGKNGIPESHPDKIKGILFAKEKKALKNFIKQNNNYDLFILLSHLGLDKDSVIVKHLNKPDIIIGGHTHSIISKTTFYNKTLITQAGDDLDYIGKISLEFEGKKLIKKTSELIFTDSITSDNPKMQHLIDKYNNDENLLSVINTIADSISGLDELGSLMTDAVTSRYGCDVAFQNNGGIRIPKFEQGEVKMKDIYMLDPFGNNVYVYEMNIKQVKSLIRFSYNEKEKSLLQTSGIKYKVLVDNNEKLKDIIISDYDGNEIEENKILKIGMNSYIASTYKFKYIKQISISRASTAELLIQYIANNNELNYHKVKRVAVEIR
ncbi:MAG TPA: hypothetical protein DDX39_00655 [Bacteroidales bacterium]|nr:MAG: hypothetical protein A2W98_08205 [Bacteroidetes bacterium GWF2_33_38]HBF87121.1 hypothetical protein [Bacteroidales bacterium]